MLKVKSKIWAEIPTPDNAFAPATSYLHGKNFFSRLAAEFSWEETIFFHLRGVRPTPGQKRRLDMFMKLAANPGIRDEACRAAMNVAVGRGAPANALLAGFLARSGMNRGAAWVEQVMANLKTSLAEKLPLATFAPVNGLGLHFGSADHRAAAVLPLLKKRRLGGRFLTRLLASATPESPVLLEGIIAAGFLDLGFSPQIGGQLFLVASFPALMAFAQEQREGGYKHYTNFLQQATYSYQADNRHDKTHSKD